MIEGAGLSPAVARVAIIDDIGVARAGLAAELRDAGFEPTAFADAAVCLERLADTHFDAVVCDLYLDGESGAPAFQVIDTLVSAGQRVVVYSTWALDPDVLGAVDRGCTAYVQKSASVDGLLDVLHRTVASAAADTPIITPEIAAAVQRRERFGLTPAESEVLTLVSQHLSNAQIARVRTVSEDTIKTQLASIRGKLGVSDRAGAVRAARSHGLLGRWTRVEAR